MTTRTWIFGLLGAVVSMSAGLETVHAAGGPEKRVLMIVTGADKMNDGKPTGLWLEEFAVPYLKFVEAGHVVEVVTPKGNPAPIDPRSKPTEADAKLWATASQRLAAPKALNAVDAAAFDAIFVPGGHGAMFDVASDGDVARVLSEAYQQGKVVAAVCHGPAALVGVKTADGKPVVAGKRVAAFTNAEEQAVELTEEMPFLLETRLRELGAEIVAKPNFEANAIRDGQLVTGQNPA